MLNHAPSSTTQDAVAAHARTLLQRHVSPINAAAITDHALRTANRISSIQPPPSSAIVEHIGRASAMFLGVEERQTLLEELREIVSVDREGDERRVAVHGEADMRVLRDQVRDLCDGLGIVGFAAQKVVTAISELARNIAKYAGQGEVRLAVDHDRHTLSALAIDQGPGIANLEQVLSGSYRSKTGMGRGILGVKKLADEFEIDTGPEGTRVHIRFCNLTRSDR